jgi:hypothetical protein
MRSASMRPGTEESVSGGDEPACAFASLRAPHESTVRQPDWTTRRSPSADRITPTSAGDCERRLGHAEAPERHPMRTCCAFPAQASLPAIAAGQRAVGQNVVMTVVENSRAVGDRSAERCARSRSKRRGERCQWLRGRLADPPGSISELRSRSWRMRQSGGSVAAPSSTTTDGARPSPTARNSWRISG